MVMDIYRERRERHKDRCAERQRHAKTGTETRRGDGYLEGGESANKRADALTDRADALTDGDGIGATARSRPAEALLEPGFEALS